MGNAIIIYNCDFCCRDGIDKKCPFVGLQNIGSLLINWSGFKECWTLFRVERLLYKTPKTNAQLVLELQDRRRNVALLKITEGICEACPQAILQVYLLLNTLEGNLTLTSKLVFISDIKSERLRMVFEIAFY